LDLGRSETGLVDGNLLCRIDDGIGTCARCAIKLVDIAEPLLGSAPACLAGPVREYHDIFYQGELLSWTLPHVSKNFGTMESA
jgi:hypothetical protein